MKDISFSRSREDTRIFKAYAAGRCRILAAYDRLGQQSHPNPDPWTCYLNLVDGEFFVIPGQPGVAVYNADSLRLAATRKLRSFVS